MKTIASLGLIFAFLQDKPAVTLHPGAPTEKAWPIAGTANRSNGTVVKVTAVRVERRWDPPAGRFRNFISAESRLMKSAEIDRKAFTANLRPAVPGFYDAAVYEGDQRLHAERLFLGTAPALFASTRTKLGAMIEACDRAALALDEIQKVLAGKQPGTAQAREAFIKRVHADELLLAETAGKTDLTGSGAFLNEVFSHLRNAQVWELTGKVSEEAQNDEKGGSRDIFLDPNLTFKALRAAIESARGVMAREAALSTATILDSLFAQAEAKPEKFLSKAKDAASEALKLLAATRAEDPEARAALEAASAADAPGIGEVRKALQAIVAKHLAE